MLIVKADKIPKHNIRNTVFPNSLYMSSICVLCLTCPRSHKHCIQYLTQTCVYVSGNHQKKSRLVGIVCLISKYKI